MLLIIPQRDATFSFSSFELRAIQIVSVELKKKKYNNYDNNGIGEHPML